jgi:hypothetical protein
MELGVRHILDWQGADHLVFLLALAAVYRWREWRECVWVATAFTVGHSLTLALATTDRLVLPQALVEFLIPVTIVATVLENIVGRPRGPGVARGRYRAVLAGVFGLVHGAGFASYLRAMFVEDIALPLVGFNLGIELAQVLLLVGAFAMFALVDRMIETVRPLGSAAGAVRLRTVAVSGVVLVVATRWAVVRALW